MPDYNYLDILRAINAPPNLVQDIIFKPGTKVYVKSNTFNDDFNQRPFVRKFATVFAYSPVDKIYLLKGSHSSRAERFAPSDLISLDEYKASILKKLTDFFGSDGLNFASLDDNRLIIDGAYDANALVDLIMKGEWV